jgi:hypothetical protein
MLVLSVMNIKSGPPTPERHPLGMVERAKECLRFTLVIYSATSFYVERCDESRNSSDTDRVRIVSISELDNVEINGVKLKKLVADKFREWSAQHPPQRHS